MPLGRWQQPQCQAQLEWNLQADVLLPCTGSVPLASLWCRRDLHPLLQGAKAISRGLLLWHGALLVGERVSSCNGLISGCFKGLGKVSPHVFGARLHLSPVALLICLSPCDVLGPAVRVFGGLSYLH